jgi:vacuolar-type H+-ATPase subunit H|tara:strand:+ start:711 stop:1046 length:336 start_codon:yes stop_codon:yes gene_type:complete
VVTIENQEQYLQSIKKIKQVEDKTQKEIDNYKKEFEIKIKKLELDLETAIIDAKAKGEKLVDTSIEKAREIANNETSKFIEDAKTKAENIVSEIHAQNNQKIIDILLKGVK